MKINTRKNYQTPQCGFVALQENDVIRTSSVDPWNPELEEDPLI